MQYIQSTCFFPELLLGAFAFLSRGDPAGNSSVATVAVRGARSRPGPRPRPGPKGPGRLQSQ